MSLKEIHCLSVCDYPLKRSGYEKLLKGLGFTSVYSMNHLTEIRNLSGQNFEFILIDWNIPTPMEPGFLMFFCQLFPKATIVMMEEDHERMDLEEAESRMIAKLGKRADLDLLQELMETVARSFESSNRMADIKKPGDKPPVSVAYAVA